MAHFFGLSQNALHSIMTTSAALRPSYQLRKNSQEKKQENLRVSNRRGIPHLGRADVT